MGAQAGLYRVASGKGLGQTVFWLVFYQRSRAGKKNRGSKNELKQGNFDAELDKWTKKHCKLF